MAKTRTMSTGDSAPQTASPDPAFRRFDRLIGTWDMKGRTLDSNKDNIFGWNRFEWLPGGFFLKSEGEIDFKGFKLHSLEIIGYDPQRGIFPSRVYSSMSGEVFSYWWDMRGDTLLHAGQGAAYSGTISEDGNIITGGWRPDEGKPAEEGSAYDAVMVRVK